MTQTDDNQGAPYLFKRRDRPWASYSTKFMVRGKQYMRSLGTADKKLAEERALQLRSDMRGEKWDRGRSRNYCSFEELFRIYDENSSHIAAASLKKAKTALLKLFDAKDSDSIKIISAEAASAKRTMMESKGKGRSFNSLLRHAKSIFRVQVLEAFQKRDILPPSVVLFLSVGISKNSFPRPTVSLDDARQRIASAIIQGKPTKVDDLTWSTFLLLASGLSWNEAVDCRGSCFTELSDGTGVYSRQSSKGSSSISIEPALWQKMKELLKNDDFLLPRDAREFAFQKPTDGAKFGGALYRKVCAFVNDTLDHPGERPLKLLSKLAGRIDVGSLTKRFEIPNEISLASTFSVEWLPRPESTHVATDSCQS